MPSERTFWARENDLTADLVLRETRGMLVVHFEIDRARLVHTDKQLIQFVGKLDEEKIQKKSNNSIQIKNEINNQLTTQGVALVLSWDLLNSTQ